MCSGFLVFILYEPYLQNVSGRKDVTLIDNTEFLFPSTTGGRFVYFEAGGRKHVSRFLRPALVERPPGCTSTLVERSPQPWAQVEGSVTDISPLGSSIFYKN